MSTTGNSSQSLIKTVELIADRLLRRNPFSNYDSRHPLWEEYKTSVGCGFKNVAERFTPDDRLVRGAEFCHLLFNVAAEEAAERRLLWCETEGTLETASYLNHLKKLQAVIVDDERDSLCEPRAADRKQLIRNNIHVQEVRNDLWRLAEDWTQQATDRWHNEASAIVLAEKAPLPSGEPTVELQKQKQKGNIALIDGKAAVSFAKACEYLGIGQRQLSNLCNSQPNKLDVVGGGHNRKVTTESLRKYLPPGTKEKRN